MTQYVQFTDSSSTTISAVFGCIQDSDIHPNQGIVSDSDPRYLAFITPPVAPLSCTPYQLRAALTQQMLRAQVEAAVAASPQAVKDAYAYAQVFYENDPMVTQLASAIGQTPSQVHALFQLAQTLSP